MITNEKFLRDMREDRSKGYVRLYAKPLDERKASAQDVVEERFTPRYYREKTISERGKIRVIRPPVFECKVVQKVLCDYMLRMLLESKMIYDNYASIRGRGPELCYRRILEGVNRYGAHGSVIVMTDFSNFFNSIDHGVLERILSGYIADPRVVDLFMKFCEGDAGLSLGNEASQVPASFFPSMIDHEIKDHMGAKVYCLYMDDIFFLAEDAKAAEHYLDHIRGYAGELRLVLKEEKIPRIPWGTGFAFCKERFVFNRGKGYYYRLMNPDIVRTQMRKMRRFEEKYKAGEMSRTELDAQVKTVLGMIRSGLLFSDLCFCAFIRRSQFSIKYLFHIVDLGSCRGRGGGTPIAS